MKKETPPNLPLSGEERREAPYPGLRPYHEDEQGKFFGRDVDAEILLDKVLTNRLTLLFAASGVGKSSLLQAAVIPRLKSPTGENLEVVYHIDWVSEPVSSVWAAVLQALHASGKLPEGAADEVGETLVELLEFCGLFVRHPLVLILDQFEEFFRYQRATASFQPFIEQLTAVITNPQLPVNLVLSMREDFALALNAFKPRLPTILFENFYRLEKLGRVGAREAIVTPVEQVDFHYEPMLLETLLDDLLSRELDRLPHSPLVELLETVEPPYLQIVCAQLWELNKAAPDKLLRLVTYEKAGKAKGILSNYLNGVLQTFTLTEKQLASKAFDHLASQRGVKMAYTAAALAETVRVNESALGKVLEKLTAVRILRSQQRGDATWYELYHDMFSGSIESWNGAWKDRMRTRKIVRIVSVALANIIAIFAGGDYYINATSYHFRVNYTINNSLGRIELWQGKPKSIDLFNQTKYIAETNFLDEEVEPDKRFSVEEIINYKNASSELISKFSLIDRISYYAKSGKYQEAIALAKKHIHPNNANSSIDIINKIENIRTPEFAKFINEVLFKNNDYKAYYNYMGNTPNSIGIILFDELIKICEKGNISILESGQTDFLVEQLSKQASRQKARSCLFSIIQNYKAKPSLSFGYKNSPSAYYNYNADTYTKSISLSIRSLLVSPDLPLRKKLLTLLKDKKYEQIRNQAIDLILAQNTNEKLYFIYEFIKNDPIQNNMKLYEKIILELDNSEDSINLLTKTLEHKNTEIRKASINRLIDILKYDSISLLMDNLLKPHNEEIKNDLIWGIKQIPEDWIDLYFKNEIKINSHKVGRLIDLSITTKNTEKILIDIISDTKKGGSSSRIKSQAITLAGRLKIKALSMEIMKLIHDKDNEIRFNSIIAIGRLQEKEAIPILLDIFNNEKNNKYIHDAVTISLVVLGVKDAYSDLSKLLDKKNSYYINTSFIITLLGETESQDTLPLLLNMLDSEDEDIRYFSLKSINMIVNKNSIDISKKLMTLVNDKIYHVRLLAVKSLIKADEKRAISLLIELLASGSRLIFQEDIISLLEKADTIEINKHIDYLIKSDNKEMRKLAAWIIGKLKINDSFDKLNILLNDKSSDVKASAIWGMFHLNNNSDAFLSRLLVLLDNEPDEVKQEIIESLIEFTPHNMEALIPKLIRINEHTRSNKIKNSIIALLTKLGVRESVYFLEKNIENETYQASNTTNKLHYLDANELTPLLLDKNRHSELNPNNRKNYTLWPTLVFNLFRDGSNYIYDPDNKYEWMNLNILKILHKYSDESIVPFFLGFSRNKGINESFEIIMKNKNISTLYKKIIKKHLLLSDIGSSVKEDVEHSDFIINNTHIDGMNLTNIKTNFLKINTLNNKDISDTENYLLFEYAYAIANMDEAEGIKLLGHNLAKVREAAARGLANSDFLGVPLLQKLEQEWLATDNPITHQGLFHAIDIALLAMEGIGADKELEALKAYEPTLTNERSAASIKPRVEWTRIQLQWRVDALKELKELADRQLPGLLKEYCINPDGTDMKPEECTIER